MTTVVLNTTTRKVEAFSSARDVQARAEIADHKAAADPHPQYLGQADAAAVATSGDAADVRYAAPSTGAVARSVASVFGEAVRITDYGGVGDDATDNSTAIANAMAAAGLNRPIVLNNGDYNLDEIGNLYGSEYKDALGTLWTAGTADTPTTRHEPLVWVSKIGAGNRDTITTGYDQSFYALMDKTEGDAPGIAITGYARIRGGDGVRAVGTHARAQLLAETGQVWGLWAYANVSPSATGGASGVRAVAAELNVRNGGGVDYGWSQTSGTNSITGMTIAMAEGTSPGTGTHALTIRKHTGEGWYSGIVIFQNSIMSDTNSAGKAEAIRIRGGSSSARRYTGMWFEDGFLRTGINFNGPNYHNSAAMVLPTNNKVLFGDDTDAVHALYLDASGRLNFDHSAGQSQLWLRRSDAHAASATIGVLDMVGQDDTAAGTAYGRILTVSSDNAAATATGEMRFSARNSGSLVQQLAIKDGVKVGSSVGFTGVGTINAENGYYNNNIPWLTGSGSPEGAVTAPVGALFSRTDGGASATFYVKESGTGNTGWAAK